MDDVALNALLAALAASPENVTLRVTVVRLLLDGGAHARALEHATGTEPELMILRARALYAMDDQPAALAAYEAAVHANPTLEDRDLRVR
ncbi:MAG TPA: hypothetical protein VIV11_18740, partial [Kofleriaceae bacterium]